MKLEPLTEQNISYVFGRLWMPLKRELRIFNVSIEERKEDFLFMIGKPFTGAVLDSANTPCALIALKPIGQLKWKAHFATTEEGFNRVWVSLSRFLLKFSDELEKDSGKIQICSAFGDGKPREWFETMGFSYRGFQGPFHYYWKG